jgi:uronate dehydrogenase
MNTSRILITGAGGTVGRGVRPYLADQFVELVLVDRSPIETIAANERAVIGDINDPTVIAKVIEGVDGVLHLACAYAHTISLEETLETNYRGLARLLDAFVAARGKCFVFASSHHGWGFYPRGTAIPVEVPPRPDGWYGVSKVFGEAALAFYAHSHGFSGVSLRIGNSNAVVADERLTHMWISFRDLAAIATRALQRTEPGHIAVYATADCADPFFDNSGLSALGIRTSDRPEDHLADGSGAMTSVATGIAGQAVGGAYTEANLKTDLAVWARSVGRLSIGK